MESAQEAEARLATSPVEARRKVLLIREAHRMNIATANALLKTIEEPPSYALIILVTDRPGMLPMTIRSRCSPVRCGEIDTETLADWLLAHTGRGLKNDRDLARFFALLSEGCPGRALALAGSGVLQKRGEALEALETFDREGYLAFMTTAHRLAQGTDDLGGALALLFTWYRDLLVARMAPGTPELLINRDHAELVERLAEKKSVRGLVAALECIAERFDLTDRIAPAQLVLESLLVDVGMAAKN